MKSRKSTAKSECAGLSDIDKETGAKEIVRIIRIGSRARSEGLYDNRKQRDL